MVKWYSNNEEMQKDIRNQNRSRNVKKEAVQETNKTEPKSKKKKVIDSDAE